MHTFNLFRGGWGSTTVVHSVAVETRRTCGVSGTVVSTVGKHKIPYTCIGSPGGFRFQLRPKETPVSSMMQGDREACRRHRASKNTFFFRKCLYRVSLCGCLWNKSFRLVLVWRVHHQSRIKKNDAGVWMFS